MKFNIRIKNYELRSCNKHLLSEGDHDTAEIVEWSEKDNSHCWAIAYWVTDGEGYYLRFVEHEAFKCNPVIIFKLVEVGFELLRDSLFINKEF